MNADEAMREHSEVIDGCSKRTDFQLTYERSKEQRRFLDDGITGPSLADAYRTDGRSPGDWSNGGALTRCLDNQPVPTEAQVFAQFFNDAVSEAVHEALEWFRIDGRCAINPHDDAHEQEIFALCGEFASKLWALRAVAAVGGEQR